MAATHITIRKAQETAQQNAPQPAPVLGTSTDKKTSNARRVARKLP